MTIWVKPDEQGTLTPKQNIQGSKVMLFIWLDQNGDLYYELLKPPEAITDKCSRLQLINLKLALSEK